MALFEAFCAGISNPLEEYERNRHHEIMTQIVPVPLPIFYSCVAKLTDLMCLGLDNLQEPVNEIMRFFQEGLSSSFCIDGQVDDEHAASVLLDCTQPCSAMPDESVPNGEDLKVLIPSHASFGDGMYAETSTNLMLDKGCEYGNGVPHAATEEKVRDLVLFFKEMGQAVDSTKPLPTRIPDLLS